MNGLEKELNRGLEEALKVIFESIGKLLKGIFLGIKQLKNLKYLIAFGCMVGIAVSAYFLRGFIFKIEAPIYIQRLIYLTFLCVPIIYLVCIGNVKDKIQEKYRQMFKEIEFKGKDNKYPYFLGVREADKKLIYTFKSNISIDEWKGNKGRLETAMNCNILQYEQENNKKVIQLTTVPADFKIPTMLKWDDQYIEQKDGVIKLGESALQQISFDLNRVPHVLAAGETGSGKSVILRVCLWQMIKKGCKVFMIDFKGGVEFGLRYEDFGEVITERKRALEVLTLLVEENEKRLALFRQMQVKNLAEFNSRTGKNLCRIGVFCDEIAEMLDKTGISKEDKPLFEQIEGKLATLARLSRATGINLFLGVQRPDAKILPGQIKNNIPVRISGHFADKAASEIVLGTTDAGNLPDIKGRFLFKVGNEIIQFQSYYFDDDTMLHDVDVTVGGTLTEMKEVKKQVKGLDDIKIFEETPKVKVKKLEDAEGFDLNFDYNSMWDDALKKGGDE
ncbi:FtsK/SpoIIIE domain-containing protein [Anaeromicropila populeti]|uniref:DNA segregation ATPase FtsK/SpoIIIE, S-DNA-T family n=1 Tax=Anaeromicropila populeti TaxID=37658 RepID=A0A1I6LX29_9FIRM|nr:FtsK/SpoIIIE domain-containing protein [Anaeromicropila populeti]SFS08021.1 DNA segregation ATPase FtsK/SpoIIIE, S-DNA-T family [Anaeromicropila populeti]